MTTTMMMAASHPVPPAVLDARLPMRFRLPALPVGRLRAALVLEVSARPLERPARRRARRTPEATVDAFETWRRKAIDARLGAGF